MYSITFNSEINQKLIANILKYTAKLSDNKKWCLMVLFINVRKIDMIYC